MFKMVPTRLVLTEIYLYVLEMQKYNFVKFGYPTTMGSSGSFICNTVLSPQEYDFEYGVNTNQQTQITYFI